MNGRTAALAGLRVGAVALALTATLALAGPASAQQPLTVGLDGTFAPHAMPKVGGGVEGFNVDMANEIAGGSAAPSTWWPRSFRASSPASTASASTSSRRR